MWAWQAGISLPTETTQHAEIQGSAEVSFVHLKRKDPHFSFSIMTVARPPGISSILKKISDRSTWKSTHPCGVVQLGVQHILPILG